MASTRSKTVHKSLNQNENDQKKKRQTEISESFGPERTQRSKRLVRKSENFIKLDLTTSTVFKSKRFQKNVNVRSTSSDPSKDKGVRKGVETQQVQKSSTSTVQSDEEEGEDAGTSENPGSPSAENVKIDHGYSGAPPRFMKKSLKQSAFNASEPDERQQQVKEIQSMLGSQTTSLVMCPQECRGTCTDVHHPLLVALLNCRDINDREEMRKRLVNLLNVVKKFVMPGKLGIAKIVDEDKKPWKLSDPIPDCVEKYRIPLLHWAATIGAVKAIEWLLGTSNDHDMMGKDKNGKGVLHKAVHCLQENYDVDTASKQFARMLRHLGGALYVQDNNGDTPLHLCATFLANDFPNPAFFRSCILSIVKVIGEMEGERMLVELIGKQNKTGNTCLHALFGSDKMLDEARFIIRALSRCKFYASAYRPNNKGDTPIHVAMRCGCRRILEEVTWHSMDVITMVRETGLPEADRFPKVPVISSKRMKYAYAQSLSPDDAYWIIKQRKCSGEQLKPRQEMPWKAKSGSVFLYLSGTRTKDDSGLFTDGYRFCTSAASRDEIERLSLAKDGLQWVLYGKLLLPKITKKCYLLTLRDTMGNILCTGDFRKEVWSIVDEKRHQAKLVHYVGNGELGQDEALLAADSLKSIRTIKPLKRKIGAPESEDKSGTKRSKLHITKDKSRFAKKSSKKNKTEGSSGISEQLVDSEESSSQYDTEIIEEWSSQDEFENQTSTCDELDEIASLAPPADFLISESSAGYRSDSSPDADDRHRSLTNRQHTHNAERGTDHNSAFTAGVHDTFTDDSQDAIINNDYVESGAEENQDGSAGHSDEEGQKPGTSKDQSADDMLITFDGDSITLEEKHKVKKIADDDVAKESKEDDKGMHSELLAEAIEQSIAKLSGANKPSDYYEPSTSQLKVKIPTLSSSDEVTSEFMHYMFTCDAKEREKVMEVLNAEVQQCSKRLNSIGQFSEALTSRYDYLQQHQVKLVLEVQKLLQRKIELQKEDTKLCDSILDTESELSNSKETLVGLTERLAHCHAALQVLKDIVVETKVVQS